MRKKLTPQQRRVLSAYRDGDSRLIGGTVEYDVVRFGQVR